MEGRWPGVWGAVHDERTCATCRLMTGQIVWSDAAIAPPVHDRCRCVLLRLPIDLARLTAEQRIQLGAALAAGEAMAARLRPLGPAGGGGGRQASGGARPASRARRRSSASRATPSVLQGGSDAAGSWLQRLSDAAFAAFNEAGGVFEGGRAKGSGGVH